jgi:hypothetical protein
MQMHYSLVASNGKPDQTSVVLELGDTASTRELAYLAATKLSIDIPAGAADWKETTNISVGALEMEYGLPAGDIAVYGAFPHMHLLGKRTALTVMGGPLMIEIPHWDFHWQNTYSLVTPPILHPTDTLQLECDYDNSFANQPVVMGQQQPPREVKWGESTLDEMCATGLTVAPVN